MPARHHLNQRRTVSHARPSMLAAGTSASATRGNSASGAPSKEILTVPTRKVQWQHQGNYTAFY